MRYIALLRGVNVTGANMIKMDALRRSFENLGFQKVASYINSGNIGFDTKKTAETKLVARIEQEIENEFALRVSVMIRERSSIAGVLANNPFIDRYERPQQMNVFFLREEISAEKQQEILALGSDKEFLAIREREIYLLLLCGFPESLLGRGLIERRLKIPVTVRNWRTVEKLAVL